MRIFSQALDKLASLKVLNMAFGGSYGILPISSIFSKKRKNMHTFHKIPATFHQQQVQLC